MPHPVAGEMTVNWKRSLTVLMAMAMESVPAGEDAEQRNVASEWLQLRAAAYRKKQRKKNTC